MNTERKARGSAMELILSVCSGLRKVPAKTPEEEAYNNALGDVFDYIIKNEQDCLMSGTVQGGVWNREQNIPSAVSKPAVTPPDDSTGDMHYLVRTYSDNRKQLPFAPITEGSDEQDYYFCPTCYDIVGTHDEDDMERPNYCPNCGQKLLRQERYEKQINSRIKDMIRDGILEVEQKEDTLFCSLLKEVPFVAPVAAISDNEHNIHNITLVLMHPGAFGISKKAMERIWTMLWKE